MATTTVSTGASQLWGRGPRNYGGLTGAGITVAVIDSGVDRHHPDVAPSLMLEKDFTGTGEGDEYGHGTHVAGIIAGRGSRVGTESTYVGMAPGAGNHLAEGADGRRHGLVSSVLESIEWILRTRTNSTSAWSTSRWGSRRAAGRRTIRWRRRRRGWWRGNHCLASAGNLGKLDDGTPLMGGVVSPGYTPER